MYDGTRRGQDAEARDQIAQLCRDWGDAADEAAAAEGDDPSFELARARPAARLEMPTDPQEMRRQLEQMTVNEKRQVALRGRREVRLLLIKDRNKAVHPFVLKNPGITTEEVEAFSKMPSVNPDALRMIARNRDWTRLVSICRSLVRNPKTPIGEALTLLDRLPIGEIRVLAKSGNLRMPLVQAARKKVNA